MRQIFIDVYIRELKYISCCNDYEREILSNSNYNIDILFE